MSERTSPPAKDPVLEAGDLQGRSQVPRGLGGPPLIWDFHVNCKRLRRCMKQSPLPRGLETGSHWGSVRGEVRATGPLAAVTMATPESAPKPEATCLDAARGPLPRAWGCVQLASWPEGSRLTSPPAGPRAPAHPSLSGSEASSLHRPAWPWPLPPLTGTGQRGSAGGRRWRVPWADQRCPAKRTLASSGGPGSQTRVLLSAAPAGQKCRCVGIQGQALPGSRASDVAFMSVSSWQPLS